ncbi:immunoglobulin domain-containing protein [Luteolibacter marinus]|uniref:immunoglobulin domain-containing protein n=1 Tax=Luteolibacter marinus TaxID=2776705 RepID=UPI0018672FBD|nr:immunoglobulin domain-containing protein [Luteolibacter marinus]
MLEWNVNPEPDVTGYKFYYGESSGAYTVVQDAGNSPLMVLTNLESERTYFFAVTAYNAAGQESQFSEEVSLTLGSEPVDPDTSGRLVLLESEDGQIGAPMTIYSDSNATWVDSSVFSQEGWTELNFEASVPGDYQVWCRVNAPTEAKDSFFVKMDGEEEQVFHVYGTPTPPEGTRSSEWTWQRVHYPDAGPRNYTLDEGSHLLRFRVREPGTLLDRVVLSSNPAFIPDDNLPRSGDALVITGGPASQTRAPGESVDFTVAAAATGPVTFQWLKDGTALPGTNTPVLNLQNLQTSDSGNYKVSLASGSAIATSSNAVLTVGEVVENSDFRIHRLTMNPDQTVTFDIVGQLNNDVVVYASDDLVNWTLLGTHLNATGSISAADPDADGKTKRFYRLAIPTE